MDEMQKKALAEAKKRFSKQFFFTAQKVGTFEADATHPAVSITGVSSTASCDAKDSEKHYGCPEGEAAILVKWSPAGLVHDDDGKELRIDSSLIPADRSEWNTFPKTFEGFPVYYARGRRPVAGG
jgi:hypothetical protein